MDSRLAAILAADVVGYSKLMERNEAKTLSELSLVINEFVRPLVAKHNGRIVKLIGDGILAEFPSVLDAVTCAIYWQGNIAEKNSSLQFRIGINLGEIIYKDDDIFGNGVIVAARLEALAEVGGVCISDDVFRQVEGKVDADFLDMGEQQLKNIDRPVRTYCIGNQKISEEFDQGKIPGNRLAIPDKPSLAVLPFTNMSGDPDQDYFANGIVEDIITAFSRIKWLFVIARNSSFTYKGKAVDIKQIGRELGVRYLLEGSIRKAGSRIRISGQLIDALTGTHLWADRVDGEMTDIFDLQDRVTQSVVGTIAPRLEKAEIDRTRHKPTDILDAYDFYLRGMEAFHQFNPAANQKAVDMFSRCVEHDPEYAAAYGMAARCYGQRKGFGWINDLATESTEALRLARIAVSFGRDDAIALAGAGFALTVFNQLLDGDAFLDQALVANPNLAWAWHTSGAAKAFTGYPELAIERATRAMRLSPQDPQQFAMHVVVALGHFHTEHYDEAFVSAKAALRENPSFLFAAGVAAASAALSGNTGDAREAMDVVRKLDPGRRVSNLHHWLEFQRPDHAERWADGLRKAGLPE
ncbi:MAG: adenylate/guanylate cyclase domain-containing protein [Pseudomonadota bacterium]